MIENDEQLLRTRMWAASFRTSATLHDEAPRPADVDPIIWKSMRDSYASEAERLEGEITEYEGRQSPLA